MTRKRFIVEGIFCGYDSIQERVCHRIVTKTPKLFERLKIIEFTDGTRLYIEVRQCKPRERVSVIHGYDSLINKAILKEQSYVKVADLI